MLENKSACQSGHHSSNSRDYYTIKSIHCSNSGGRDLGMFIGDLFVSVTHCVSFVWLESWADSGVSEAKNGARGAKVVIIRFY